MKSIQIRKALLTPLIPLLVSGTLHCIPVWSDTAPPSESEATADQLLSKGDYKKAEETYRHLLADNPTGDAYAGLIVALTKQNRFSDAEALARQGREHFSDNSDLMAAAGFLSYCKAKKLTEAAKRDLYLSAAEKLCLSALKRNPDSIIGNQTLGSVKLASSEPQQAVESLRKTVTLAETPENLTSLALALREADPKGKERALLIKKALLIDENYVPAQVEEASILSAEGKPQKALQILRQINKGKRDAQWFLVAGDSYCKHGDMTSAFASWNDAVRADPFLSDAYEHMVDYYASHGKVDLAVAELQRGIDVNPLNLAQRERLLKLVPVIHPNGDVQQDSLPAVETYPGGYRRSPDDDGSYVGDTWPEKLHRP